MVKNISFFYFKCLFYHFPQIQKVVEEEDVETFRVKRQFKTITHYLKQLNHHVWMYNLKKLFVIDLQ